MNVGCSSEPAGVDSKPIRSEGMRPWKRTLLHLLAVPSTSVFKER